MGNGEVEEDHGYGQGNGVQHSSDFFVAALCYPRCYYSLHAASVQNGIMDWERSRSSLFCCLYYAAAMLRFKLIFVGQV